MSSTQYKGAGTEFPVPPQTSQIAGSRTPFSKKYVRATAREMRDVILPVSADSAAQTVIDRGIPRKGSFTQFAAIRKQIIQTLVKANTVQFKSTQTELTVEQAKSVLKAAGFST